MTHDDRLRSPYRPVRPVGAHGDGPWPGMLSCLASGERRVLVDAAALGTEWRGWDASADGHVLAPLDIVRRADGHDAVLPVCTERVEDFVARRRAARAPLDAGEAVTLGVSILRGCAQLLDAPGATGEWWLTEAGRPVFASDASPNPVLDGATALLTDLAASGAHPLAWSDAVAAITAARPSPAELERAEQGLFGLAEPLPLVMSVSGPRGARELTAYERTAAAPVDRPARPALWDSLLRHVDADFGDLVSRTTTAVWRRARTRGSGRRAPWLVGGAVAAAVLGVGLMWPTGDGDTATAGGPATNSPLASEPAPTGAASTTPVESPAPPVESLAPAEGSAVPADDLAGIVSALLDRRRECEGDGGCLRSLLLDPSATFAAGPIDLPRDERSVVLLDDFGGVAVLRVDAVDGESMSQLVVIVRTEDEWLLRDVHDAAQQP